MPQIRFVDIPELDQGATYLCWLFCVEECFSAAGAPFEWQDLYARVKGKPYVAPGEPATFVELESAIRAAAVVTGAQVQWLGTSGQLDNPQAVDGAISSGWFVIAGVAEKDLLPGQDYYHFLVARAMQGQDIVVVDSYRHEDGGSDSYSAVSFHQAMADNFDPVVDALAFKLTVATAATAVQANPPALSRDAQLVTMLSVVGDLTYPDGQAIDDSRRIRIRQLVQAAKALLGA
ncbi:MAG: hypothetical protein JOZ39_07345 [Chloroflexi bacterium]|nr:hypothetical protein [Chloroflexota bacterium]